MPSSRFSLVPNLRLKELKAHHQDVVSSLRLYFSSAAPTFTQRFLGQRQSDVVDELERRINESELMSSFTLLTSLEASFRIDFDSRCRRRLKDDLSVYFREIEKERRGRVRLDEDILEGWSRYSSASTSLIRQIRGAFKFRHWLAHGRYWTPKYGPEYYFDRIYTLTAGIMAGFSFES